MKYKFIAIISALIIFNCNCASTPSDNGSVGEAADASGVEQQQVDITPYLVPVNQDLPVLEFNEVWAYVVTGRESSLTRDLPITDVVYFSAAVNAYGKLIEIPRRSAIPSHFTGRVHLSVICNGYGLSHFVLKPGTPERRELIADLIEATASYDGLNIDMENVPVLAGANFASFLRELRAGLPRGKMFTICVPARTRKLQSDAYDYDRITPLVERVFVMAYDEHWSGSRPGSVASIAWCRNVADYSLRTIGKDKLVMGLPFYGRTWGDYTPSRALIYNSVQNVIRDNNVTNVTYEDGIPTFTYSKNVNVKVYFEDEYSLVTRMNMYKNMGVASVGFWRMGQETPGIWRYLRIQSGNTALAAITPAPANTVTAPPAAASAFTGRYTVRSGDSLWTLARRYGVTMQALAEANGMRVNDNLHIGRVLRVPAR